VGVIVVVSYQRLFGEQASIDTRIANHCMTDHISRILRLWLLLGAALFSAGIALGCAEALRASARLVELKVRPLSGDEYREVWQRSLEIDSKLVTWATRLAPLGAGAILAAVTGLAWRTKPRFSLRSLLIGVTFLCLVLGIPFGAVRPHLQNPEFSSQLEFGMIRFDQHLDGSGNGYGIPLGPAAIWFVLPLVILPVIFFVPKRAP
jgi:hypothetical protein